MPDEPTDQPQPAAIPVTQEPQTRIVVDVTAQTADDPPPPPPDRDYGGIEKKGL